MAHEVETMAYANEVPWHGLGARVDQSATVEEMLEAAGLNWRMEAVPLQVAPGETTPDDMVGMEVPRWAHIRNTDKRIMAIASKDWKPLQPADTIGFMRDYVQAGAATLETAGSLRDGKLVWGLARLKHDFEVRPGDRVNGYLLITSPNEVGKAISVRTTTVRVVCANTMAMAHAAGAGTTNYSQSHIGDFDVAAAKEAVGNAHDQLAQAERNARKLDALKLSASDAITKVLAPVFFPVATEHPEELEALQMPETMPRKLAEILTSVNEGPGNKEVSGTGWGILNGVTHWADHVAGRTSTGRLEKAWMGETGRQKLKVEEKLLELAS